MTDNQCTILIQKFYISEDNTRQSFESFNDIKDKKYECISYDLHIISNSSEIVIPFYFELEKICVISQESENIHILNHIETNSKVVRFGVDDNSYLISVFQNLLEFQVGSYFKFTPSYLEIRENFVEEFKIKVMIAISNISTIVRDEIMKTYNSELEYYN